MQSPQTTGSIPPSIPQSGTPAPSPTRNPSKPIANAASTPSPIRTDQAKQPKTPPLNRAIPPTQADEISPPKP
jgi:hypothetical protein